MLGRPFRRVGCPDRARYGRDSLPLATGASLDDMYSKLFASLSAAVLLLLLLGGVRTAAQDLGAPPTVKIGFSDSVAAAQFEDRLPVTLMFNDRMGTAMVGRVETPLPLDGADHLSEYTVGEVGYWAAEQSIVVFLHSGSAVPLEGIVSLGHVTAGFATLAGCARDCAVRVVPVNTPLDGRVIGVSLEQLESAVT
jgi:hypothetical protein